MLHAANTLASHLVAPAPTSGWKAAAKAGPGRRPAHHGLAADYVMTVPHSESCTRWRHGGPWDSNLNIR
jgi:hypothetical protein